MKKTVLSVLVLLAATLAAPAWADGYLSAYSGSGGGHYLSGYSRGGYYGGRSAGYKYYGGPNGRIERKHGGDWYRYQEKLRRDHASVEPGAGPSWLTARATYNPMGIPLGFPRGSKEICGTYLRKPALCTTATTRYDPLIHGN